MAAIVGHYVATYECCKSTIEAAEWRWPALQKCSHDVAGRQKLLRHEKIFLRGKPQNFGNYFFVQAVAQMTTPLAHAKVLYKIIVKLRCSMGLIGSIFG